MQEATCRPGWSGVLRVVEPGCNSWCAHVLLYAVLCHISHDVAGVSVMAIIYQQALPLTSHRSTTRHPGANVCMGSVTWSPLHECHSSQMQSPVHRQSCLCMRPLAPCMGRVQAQSRQAHGRFRHAHCRADTKQEPAGTSWRMFS